MLKKLSEKLRAKFPATTPSCSMLKFACLDDVILEVLTASKPSTEKVNHCSKKKRKRGGRKKIPKIEKPKDVGHFPFSSAEAALLLVSTKNRDLWPDPMTFQRSRFFVLTKRSSASGDENGHF